MNKPELLAPAGSFESLEAALRCGADAVYAGSKSFSARQNASNFEHDELKSAIDLCHLYGKKLYLTVNTLILDNQIKDFSHTIEKALLYGVDAFIVQDLGAAEIIKSIAPDARMHASTQMTVHSENGALFAKKLGFKRVVLSRELSEEQINQISALDIETEIFVHGALCMSVSGQCFLSALIGQRSANRGLCAQPCRLPFSAKNNCDYCGLSLKDLSLIDYVKNIQNNNVTSLKIEGRMKRPEYVAAAVSAFRNAIDGNEYDVQTLRAVFSRSGFTDGYYTQKYTNMFGTRQKEDVTAAKDVLPEIRQLYKSVRKVSDVHFSAKIKADSPVMLSAYDNLKNSVSVTGNIPQTAINKPVNTELLNRQFSKLGDTIYNFDGIDADIDDGLSVSIKELNELRRNAIEKLNNARISANTHKYNISRQLPEIKNVPKKLSQLRVRISSLNQLESTKNADMVIVPLSVISPEMKVDVQKIIVEPPRFISNENEIIQKLTAVKQMGINHIMVNNVAYIPIAQKLEFIPHGDFGLNVFNSYTANLFAKMGINDLTLSFELKLGQISEIKSVVPVGIIAYGQLPVMLTKNCPIKNEIGCSKCKKTLVDRTGRCFKIECHGNYTELLNSQHLYLADRLGEIKNVDFITLYFTDEKPSEIENVIYEYRNGCTKKENITRGLYYRGVL